MAVSCSIYLDIAQLRPTGDDYLTVDLGTNIDYSNSSCFSTPQERVCLCMPLPYTSEWASNFTGLYYRKHVADFEGFEVPGDWKDSALVVDGNNFLSYTGGIEGPHQYRVYTKEIYSAEPSIYLALGSYNAGNERLAILEFGFAQGAEDSPCLSFKVWSNGNVYVYRYGTIVGKGSIGAMPTKVEKTTEEVADYGKEAEPPNAETPSADMPTERNILDFIILLGMDSRVTVLTNGGGGFTVDLELGPTEDVVPSGNRFFFRPLNGTVEIQVANCNFQQTATVTTRLHVPFGFPSQYDTVDKRIFGTTSSRSGVSFGTIVDQKMQPDLSGPWNGSQPEFRMRYILTSIQTRTPFWYAAEYNIYSGQLPTPDAAINITKYVKSWDLRIDGEGNYSELELTLTKVKEFETMYGGVPRDATPILLTLNDEFIFTGVMTEYEIDDSSHNPALLSASMKFVDTSYFLSNYILRDLVVLDGLTVEEALGRLVKLGIGSIDPNISIKNSQGQDGIRIEQRNVPSSGDFMHRVERGDSAAEAIQKLADLYLPGGLRFIRPVLTSSSTYQERFFAYSRYQLPLTNNPVFKVYRSKEEAEKNGGDPVDDVCLKFTKLLMPGRFNQIIVTGRESNLSDKPIQVVRSDYLSQDPTLDPRDRPDNWKGHIATYGFYAPEVVGREKAIECCDLLFEELCVRHREMEITTFNPLFYKNPTRALWLGDEIWVQGRGQFYVRNIRMHGELFPQKKYVDGVEIAKISHIETTYTGRLTQHPTPGANEAYDERQSVREEEDS